MVKRFPNCDFCGTIGATKKTQYKNICDRCISSYGYRVCEQCGVVITNLCDEKTNTVPCSGTLCRFCYNFTVTPISTPFIWGYPYESSMPFFGDRDKSTGIHHQRFYGLELEIESLDNVYKKEYIAERLHTILDPKKKMFHIVTDSSLSDGLEIITHPRSLASIVKGAGKQLLVDISTLLMEYNWGCTIRCGGHIHVSNKKINDLTFSKMLYLICHHFNETLILSMRSPSKSTNYYEDNLLRYKRYDKNYSNYPLKCAMDFTNKYHPGTTRQALVIKTRHNTSEFRFWDGSINPEHIIARCQFIDSLIELATKKDVNFMNYDRLYKFTKQRHQKYIQKYFEETLYKEKQ